MEYSALCPQTAGGRFAARTHTAPVASRRRTVIALLPVSSSGSRNHATSHHCRRWSSAVSETLSRSVTVITAITAVTCTTVQLPLVDDHRETRRRRVAVFFSRPFCPRTNSIVFIQRTVYDNDKYIYIF